MKQLQIVWRNHVTYDVSKLWNKTKNIKTNRIYLNKIIHNLDKELWTILINKTKNIKTNQIHLNKIIHIYHLMIFVKL